MEYLSEESPDTEGGKKLILLMGVISFELR